MILFVTGTDTGVGKTFFTVNLLKVLKESGKDVLGFKPVETGCDPVCEDATKISEVCGKEIPPVYSFKTPVAPSVAEILENRKIDIGLLKEKIREYESETELLIVEGAGGIMVPISGSYTFLDFAREIADEVAIVALNKLGVINHTLLTVEVCKYNNLNLKGVFLNNFGKENERKDVSRISNFDTLKELLNVPVFKFKTAEDFKSFVEFF
ncbi:dethiobiotin synthase [Desulfurobacterium atlanticum]|uniref:ATP-dependent dethiobiotin synthetase BioD n=1 Tax=Desulfurobacterium atlanticum TaxID=240169 RepID=A0A238ZEJ4_9BACT|nr:dethiobiotin synthase [Desulfurobacterium atlanticum]SNR81936.1 dethiobiotin synthetase [Desulfurobacterium atlanticum]